MQTLFNMKTSPPNPESQVHIDMLKEWYGMDGSLKGEVDGDGQKMENIVSTFDLIHLIGWKYHAT